MFWIARFAGMFGRGGGSFGRILQLPREISIRAVKGSSSRPAECTDSKNREDVDDRSRLLVVDNHLAVDEAALMARS